MSDDEDDLFGGNDSDDTADLIQQASTKKSDDLFDSDDDEKKKTPKSKKEKLQALNKKRKDQKAPVQPKPAKQLDSSNLFDDDDDDSVDSANIQRTADDDNFIDNTGVDEDDLAEYYAEQKFSSDDNKKRKYREDEAIEDNTDKVPDNPIMAAVHKMQRKKRTKKSFIEQEDEIRTFLGAMENAADEDLRQMRHKQPATQKIAMLQRVVDTMAQKDTQRLLLDLDLLSIVKRWIEPLPDRSLGNVTLRQRLLEAIQKMSHGENGINSNDLKRSEVGKTIMLLYKHPKETPANKKILKELIEAWSRPIFQKSGNMRDLERVHQHRGPTPGVPRAAAPAAAAAESNDGDFGSLLNKGRQKGVAGQRVRVPFSKGFAYSVRPEARVGDSSMKRQDAGDTRGKLNKRMVEKSRTVAKNQRSANISIEGRRTKG